MPLEAGTRIGPYELLGVAGAGGMGEVHRARDVRLNRIVALKFLRGAADDDAGLRARFEREARAVAALNHPNICAIHDVGRHDGRDFLVMEFLEGETLEQRLARGRLSAADLLTVAADIARALVAAHQAGITHRDLKPSNVMVTRSGVKLLDFGIAKQHSPAGEQGAPAEADVTALARTRAGELIGSLPYMSPEQVEGNPIDRRTDIFAFGALLYEMATGRRAFTGDSSAAHIAAILGDSRPQLPEDLRVPPLLTRIVAGCLARDPRDRWQDMGDVLRVLTWAADPGRTDVARPRRWRVHALWAGAALAAIVLMTAWRPDAPSTPPPNPRPVIVLMDSPLPGRVYDPRTAAAGGTNADDVTDALRDLPVLIRKENTSPLWHREEQVVAENPDLIVTHLSCLYDARVAGEQREMADHIFEQAENRLLLVLAYVAARNPRTRFIVYSRSVFIERPGWVADSEARLPVLKGRLQAFTVPGGGATATFRDATTAKMLRERVVQILGLPETAR